MTVEVGHLMPEQIEIEVEAEYKQQRFSDSN